LLYADLQTVPAICVFTLNLLPGLDLVLTVIYLISQFLSVVQAEDLSPF